MTPLASCGALTYVAVAAVWDFRTRRIPNWLSGTAFLAALAIASAHGGTGLKAAALGTGLGLGLFLVPFLLGAVGAGDVKFAGVVGAWLGPSRGLDALVLGLAVGLFTAIGSAAAQGRGFEALARAARMAWLFAATLSLKNLPAPPHEEQALASIPYALPLALGAAGAVLLDWRGWILT